MQSSVIQMLDGDPHVFQTAGNIFVWWSLFMMRLLRKFMQFRLDLLSLTANIIEHFTRLAHFFQDLSLSDANSQATVSVFMISALRLIRAVMLETLGFFKHGHGFAFQVFGFFPVPTFGEFGSFPLHRFGFFSEFV